MVSLPVMLFTVGCCDVDPRGKAVCGSIILGGIRHFRSRHEVAQELRKAAGANQIVNKTKMLAVVAAKELWKNRLTSKDGRRVVIFTDNDAVRCVPLTGESVTQVVTRGSIGLPCQSDQPGRWANQHGVRPHLWHCTRAGRDHWTPDYLHSFLESQKKMGVVGDVETGAFVRLSSSSPEGNGFTMTHTQEEESVLDTGTHGLTKWTRGGRDDS